jgi:hypothetical protein
MRGIIVNVVEAETVPATALTIWGPFGPAGTLNDVVPVPVADEVNLVMTVSSNLIQTVTPAGKPETVTLRFVSTRPVVGEIVIAGVAAPEKEVPVVAVGANAAEVLVNVAAGEKVAVSVGASVDVGGAGESVAVGSGSGLSGVAASTATGAASCACAANTV